MDWVNRFRWWYLGGRSITRNIFRVVAAKQGIIIITTILVVAYIMAAFYTNSGEFIIRVDHPGEKYLILSETTDFSEELITLKGPAIKNADNISIFDIDPQVMNVDGAHNGPNNIAYTFYVKNIYSEPITYTYSLNIENQTEGIEHAVWVMLYHNGKQQIYAKESQAGGPESQFSSWEFPFKEDALDPHQYIENVSGTQKGRFQLKTKEFTSERTVCMAQRDEIQPQEYDKFTVVIWLEGEDPECVNDILGGTIEMMMRFRY